MKLFEKLKLGDYLLANRVVLAPMTRARAGASRLPNALMAEYYVQRTNAGLLIWVWIFWAKQDCNEIKG